MKIEIKGNGTADTFQTKNGEIRHIIMDLPNKCYSLNYTQSCSQGSYIMFSFYDPEDYNGSYEEDSIDFTFTAENPDESKQLNRIRFTLVNKNQWWVTLIADELLEPNREIPICGH